MFRTITTKLSCLLLMTLTGCMLNTPAPTGLNLSLTRPTEQNKYMVALKPLADPIDINKMHAWEIKLRSASGEPVNNAQFKIDGGMPQHGHGLPTQPRVTQGLGDGRYLLEGMKFSMTGWWEIKLNIQSPLGPDKITFNTVIAQPGTVRSVTSTDAAHMEGVKQ